MAVRTDSASVQAIIEVDSSISLIPFIASGSSLVDWLVTKDTDGLLNAATLELIERWLAAHFYAHRDQLFTSKSTGRASASFQGQTGMILKSTQYGQTAMLLDVTGNLAKLSSEAEQGSRKKVGMHWLGTRMKGDESEEAGDQ